MRAELGIAGTTGYDKAWTWTQGPWMVGENSSVLSTSIESTLQASWHLPAWVWITGGMLCLAFSLWVYWTERGQAPKKWRVALALIRFVLLFGVLWMLSGWTWQKYSTLRPEVAIVVDHSASMLTQDVSQQDRKQLLSREAAIQNAFKRLSPSLTQQLGEDYQISWYGAGETLRPIDSMFGSTAEPTQATGQSSKLGEALFQLIDQGSSQGLAAIVFLSDGINTEGLSLESVGQLARKETLPIYTVTLGRDQPRPDVRITDLMLDREAFLGDRITVEVAVAATSVEGDIKVVMFNDANQRILDETTVQPSQQPVTARLSFQPEDAGEYQLRFEVVGPKNESDLNNNTIRQEVLVRSQTLKVLVVQQQPAYEFRFLKHLLERSQQSSDLESSFQLQTVLQEADPVYVEQDGSAIRLVPSRASELMEIDTFIFGYFDPRLISRRSQQLIYEAVTKHGAGCLFVWGKSGRVSDLSGWPLAGLLPVQEEATRDGANTSSRVSGDIVDPGDWHWRPTPLGLGALPMQLEDSVPASLEIWKQLPPSQHVTGIGPLKMGAQVLAMATNAEGGERPILVTQFAGAGRTALQASDETYRWTSFGGNDIYHQRYWEQLVRWLSRGRLSANEEESSLSIKPRRANVGQSVQIEAQLGLEFSAEDLAGQVTLSLTNDLDVQRTLQLDRVPGSQRSFRTSVKDLLPGQYRILIVSPSTSQPVMATLFVEAPPGEQAKLEANMEAMQGLAKLSRGRHGKLEDLSELFQGLPPGKSIRLNPLPSVPVWNAWWVAAIFTLLIAVEWIARRRLRML